MARAPANCHQQNLGNLLAVVTLSNLFLANVKARIATWPTRSFSHTIPTKCAIQVLPKSHIHSGKTASGTAWVSRSDRGFLTSGSGKWLFRAGTKIWQSCQVQTLKTCRKSTVQPASLAVKTTSNTCGSSVRSLSRIIRTHEPGPASDGCNEVWNPSASRGSTHEISWNFIKAARKHSAMAAMEMAMPGQKWSSKMHCIWSFSDAGSMREHVLASQSARYLSLWNNRSSFLRSSFENKKPPRQKLTQFWPNKCSMKNSESQSSQNSQAMRSSESSVKYRPKAAQNLGMKQLIVTTTATRHPDLMVNTSLGLKSLNDRRKSWPLISTPGLSSDT